MEGKTLSTILDEEAITSRDRKKLADYGLTELQQFYDMEIENLLQAGTSRPAAKRILTAVKKEAEKLSK